MVEPGYFDRQNDGLPDDVDARLDNRTAADRALKVGHPAAPQQVDGPDLMHQEEHAKAVAAKRAATEEGERVGMFSAGDHSLGGPEERGGNHAGQADDRLETDPDSRASASTAMETATSGPGEKRRSVRSSPPKEEKS